MTNNLYQINSASNISLNILCKNNYENIVYKNYNNRLVDVNIYGF